MKAAIFQGAGQVHTIETIPVPKPGPNQVLIQVERCGICGSDISMGKARTGPNPLAAAFGSVYVPGAVLGHEIGGVVVELGKGVERLKVGDRIAPMALSGCSTCPGCQTGNPLWCSQGNVAFGGYAQYAVAGEFHASLLPSEISLDCGALVEPMATSFHAVAMAAMQPNARVIVLGAGAVGLGIVHFARQAGAGMIAAVARSPERKPLAIAMGADLYLTQNSNLAEQLADLMGGPADIVFEAAGAPGLVAQGISCLRPNGQIVIAGITTEPEEHYHVNAMLKQVQIQYSTAYTFADFEVTVRALRDPACPLGQLVSRTVSLDEFPAVFSALCEGAPHNKVLVDPTIDLAA